MLSDKLSVIVSMEQPAKASSYENRIGLLSRFLENQLYQLQYLVDALKDYPVLICIYGSSFLPVLYKEIQIERDMRSWKGQLEKTRDWKVFSWKA